MKRVPRIRRPLPAVTLRQALEDGQLLGHSLGGDSWSAWRAILIAAMGETLTSAERSLFSRLTGRTREPLQRVDELCAVVGRRGGKSRALSVLAAYLASLVDHRTVLAAGERGIVLCIAPDQKQAKVTLNYCEAALQQSPILRQLIVNRTQDALELSNQTSIEVRAASFRRLRGPTYIAVLADEAAFWMSDEYSSNPDTEILNSVRPGLATTGGPLIIASSPYARRGVLWETWRRHFGPAGDPAILVVQGASRDFNPSLPQAVVDRALERDRASALAEYGAEFRSDVEALLPPEVVDACITRGVRERPRVAGHRYHAFTDPSGGSADSFTLAIAHREGKVGVLDAVRERKPPFSPDDVCREYAELLMSYGITSVAGDRYAGEWPRERFSVHGITYRPADRNKSELYGTLLPLLNSQRVDLLDMPRLEQQLIGLERRTSRGGRDSIDHSPGGHDDVANAAAGALVRAAAVPRTMIDCLDDQDDETLEQSVRLMTQFAMLRGLS